MFGLEKMISRHLTNILEDDLRKFSQYVGDETILIGAPNQIFIYLDGRDASLTPCLLRDRTWEPAVGSWLAHQLRPGNCFVDIGGNIGFHALNAGKLVGNEGLVIAFEPQARLLNLFKRSISANIMQDHIHVRRMAIGDHKGDVQLGKFEHLTGSATLTENDMIIEHETVPMMPLPDALAQISSEIGRSCKPDTIKIDVEGFEMVVWDGMKAWTRELSDLAIILEYSPVSYRDMGKDPLAFLEDFSAHGFNLAVLLPNGHTRPLSQDEWPEMAMARQQYDLVLTKGGRQD